MPVAVSQLGIVLTGVVDNMMVGWVSYEHLSAASLGNGIFIILAVISMGITNAISPLVAEADAEKKPWKCRMFLHQGVLVGIGASILTMLLMEGSMQVLPYMDQPPEDVRLGSSYMQWLSASVLPMILFLTYKQYTDGLSLTQVAMVVTLIGLAVNTLANWLLIFGHWGFPEMKLNGAGVPTLISRVVMFVLIAGFVHIYKPSHVKRSQGWRPLPRTLRKILYLGVPSGLQMFFEVGAFAGAIIIVGWIGQAPRSAHQIVLNLSSVTYMVVTGIAAGATIRVGNARGRRNMREAREAGFAGLWLGVLFMLVSAVVFVWGRHMIPAWYNDHPEVLQIASGLMVLAGGFQLFDGIQAVGLGILRGLQDVVIPMFVAFVCYWIIALPLGYVTSFTLGWGVKGIWVGFVVSLGLAAVAFVWRFIGLTRKPVETEDSSCSPIGGQNEAKNP